MFVELGCVELLRVECENCGNPVLGYAGEDTEDRCFDCLGL